VTAPVQWQAAKKPCPLTILSKLVGCSRLLLYFGFCAHMPCPGRQRRKNEALANEIFSKGTRLNTPGSGFGNKKVSPAPGSLASRVGIVKVVLPTLRIYRRFPPPPGVISRCLTLCFFCFGPALRVRQFQNQASQQPLLTI
jgi:hypothetical protein